MRKQCSDSLPAGTIQDTSHYQSDVRDGDDRQKYMFVEKRVSYRPKRSRKKKKKKIYAEFILIALTCASAVSWNDRGEVIIGNESEVCMSMIWSKAQQRHKATDVSLPAGWTTFLIKSRVCLS